MSEPLRCGWCGKEIEPTPGRRSERKWCNPAHASAYRRASRAGTLADLVEKLGPHVDEEGIFIYKELVDHLTGRVNDPAL